MSLIKAVYMGKIFQQLKNEKYHDLVLSVKHGASC